MKKAVLVLIFFAGSLLGNSQGYGLLNLYQFGATSFNDEGGVGTQNIGMSYPMFGGKGMNKEYFMQMDASVLWQGLLGVLKKPLTPNKDGYTGYDIPAFSLRLGKMYGKIGIGVDADIRALYLREPLNTFYLFNSNKFISDANFGLVATSFIPVNQRFAWSPTLGYDLMFTERQTTPVDGHLFLIENQFMLRVAGPIGLNIEPVVQLRRVRMPTKDEKHTSTMFALKFGVVYLFGM